MTALLAILIPLIPQIMQAGMWGIQFISSLRTAAQQASEWTPAAEAAFIQGLVLAYNLPQWMTDAEKGLVKPPPGSTVTTIVTPPAPPVAG
jgi:hypothetical protein